MTKNDQTGRSTTDAKTQRYEKLIDRLMEEREAVEDMLDNDYREARRYVRTHPVEGVLAAFAGGLVLGLIIGRNSK